ncbi:hypothetical protein ACIPRI_12555 [Variovorax sp. LARHSF232]
MTTESSTPVTRTPFKFPVPRLATQAVIDWADELAAHFGCTAAQFQQNPERIQFPPEIVRIELMDGSLVEFKYAIFVVSDTKRAIAVFTEHCGHHVFPYHEAKVFVNGHLKYEQQPSW